MPHYTIGHVDDSIKNIQRTFSVSDTSVYDFLQQIAEEIGWVFVFDNSSDYVVDGYGEDTGVFIEGVSQEENSKINIIRNNCDLQNFLTRVENTLGGKDLWIELCTFRRTDTYKNDNFIGEDQPESVLMENVEELLKQANIEIEKACKVNYSTTATIANLLTLKEFEPFWDKFKLGNYIRVRVDEDIYTMRIITVSFDYSDLSHCSVEFSDTIKNKASSVNQVKDILKQASSMASSYSYVARQADKGSKANQQFQNMKENGLDIANTMIKSSDNLDFVWNKYGFKGREWDDVRNEFAPEQLAMTNNLLAFTKDSWEHTCAAIGKISYFDDVDQTYKWDYGINAGVLIGDLVMSEQLRIMNDSGNYYIDKNGFTMVKKDSNGKVLSEIAIKPENPSMVLSRNGESLFDFNSDGKGCLRIGSDTSGITFDQSGNAEFAGKISSSSGDIGSWHIDGSGIYNSGSNYLTTIGNRDDYKIDNKNYQMTINNGKIICGVESDDKTKPITSHGYVDVSAKGIYAKPKGNTPEDSYLFAVDTEQNLVISNTNIYASNIGEICIRYIQRVEFQTEDPIGNLDTMTWNHTYDTTDITNIMVIPSTQSYGIVTSENHSNGKLTLTMKNISGETHTLGCIVYYIGYQKISSNS